MNETFCTDVSDCSEFDCNEFLCWDGYNLRPNIPQVWSLILYIFFRILERVIFAYLGQVNRELLQLTKEERRDMSTCCFTFDCRGCKVCPKIQSKLPSGIYKQAWLRFFGTFIGVLSFILILERNVYMFVSLIVIDSFGVGIISYYQHKDAPNTQSELAKIEIYDDIDTRDLDQKWLDNMRKFLADPKEKKENVGNSSGEDQAVREMQRPLLKFL